MYTLKQETNFHISNEVSRSLFKFIHYQPGVAELHDLSHWLGKLSRDINKLQHINDNL